MEDWVLERLREFVGRNDRESLAPRVPQALVFQSMGEQASYRATCNLPSLGRGLVVAEEGVVPHYARVRRVFHLTNAITKYYYSPFYLEAKVSGYHARIAWLGGRQVGFTRDGRYCAFATDRARDFIPDSFFEENPHLVVCLTLEGKGIPYARPAYGDTVDDVIGWGTGVLERGVREPMTTAARYELFDKHDIMAAEHVGPFDADDIDKVIHWMKEFEAAGGRGIVLKPSERHHRPLKYSLPSALLHSTPSWLGLVREIEEAPYFARLLQAACSATELGLSAEEWDWATVGKSIFSSLAQATEGIVAGSALAEEYSVWLHQKESSTTLIEQLEERSAETTIHQLELVAEEDGWRLRFERRFVEATAAMERRLSGASYRS